MILDAEFDAIALPILESPLYAPTKEYVAHGNTSVYGHCLNVATSAYAYAKSKKMQIDYHALIRGALLHDYYLYDWHDKQNRAKYHGFSHPFIAAKNAKRDFHLNKKELHIIEAHMFPLVFWIFPGSKEARLVSKFDKKCCSAEHKGKPIPLFPKLNRAN